MSDELKTIRGSARQNTHAISQLAQAGAPLESEPATIAQALLGHPEYYDIWNRIPELGDEEIQVEGANSLLHVTIHSIVEGSLSLSVEMPHQARPSSPSLSPPPERSPPKRAHTGTVTQ